MAKSKSLESLYATYVKTYRRAEEKGTYRYEEMYSLREFESAYRAMRNTLIEYYNRKAADTADAKRAIAHLNVNRELVSRQAETMYSAREARALRTGLEVEGVAKLPSIKQLRTGQYEMPDWFWDNIQRERARLFRMGYSKKQVAERISQRFFYISEN